MRISRKKRPEKPLIVNFRKNFEIDVPQVMVLDETGKPLGTMTTQQAVGLAQERGLDLVEINPKSEPPVTKLVSFSEFKYQKEKAARKQKAHSHTSEIKGIRLSIRIGEHDLATKKGQAEKFLDRGDKVKVELILRGRENGKQDLANDIIRDFVKQMGEIVPIRLEQDIQRQGHKMTAIIAKK